MSRTFWLDSAAAAQSARRAASMACSTSCRFWRLALMALETADGSFSIRGSKLMHSSVSVGWAAPLARHARWRGRDATSRDARASGRSYHRGRGRSRTDVRACRPAVSPGWASRRGARGSASSGRVLATSAAVSQPRRAIVDAPDEVLPLAPVVGVRVDDEAAAGLARGADAMLVEVEALLRCR